MAFLHLVKVDVEHVGHLDVVDHHVGEFLVHVLPVAVARPVQMHAVRSWNAEFTMQFMHEYPRQCAIQSGSSQVKPHLENTVISPTETSEQAD